MEANEMEAGTRDQGGQALEEFERCHDDMRGAIAVGGFELQDDVAFLSASQPFVAQGGTGDVTRETFERGPLMWATVHRGMQTKAMGGPDTGPGVGLTALAWRGPEPHLSR